MMSLFDSHVRLVGFLTRRCPPRIRWAVPALRNVLLIMVVKPSIAVTLAAIIPGAAVQFCNNLVL